MNKITAAFVGGMAELGVTLNPWISVDDSHQTEVTKTSPLESFNLFPNLPLELRLKIFRCARPGPRVVPVRRPDSRRDMVTRLPVPSLLHVCSDARTEFMKFYELLRFKSCRLTNVYIDFEVDTLLFGEEDEVQTIRSSNNNGWSDLICFMADVAHGTLNNIRCLSIDAAVFYRYGMPASIIRFTSLQQFTIWNTEEKLKGKTLSRSDMSEPPQVNEADDLDDYVQSLGSIERHLDEELGRLIGKDPEWPLVSWGAARWDIRNDALVLLRDQKELNDEVF